MRPCMSLTTILVAFIKPFTLIVALSSAGLNDATAVSIIANVYPNPAEDKATISVNGLMNATMIVVSDMQGRILLSDDMNESTYELNTSNYAAGVYYIRIISGNTVNTQKLIVK